MNIINVTLVRVEELSKINNNIREGKWLKMRQTRKLVWFGITDGIVLLWGRVGQSFNQASPNSQFHKRQEHSNTRENTQVKRMTIVTNKVLCYLPIVVTFVLLTFSVFPQVSAFFFVTPSSTTDFLTVLHHLPPSLLRLSLCALCVLIIIFVGLCAPY